jgi:nucleotide-binding universal stress UspA family protein
MRLPVASRIIRRNDHLALDRTSVEQGAGVMPKRYHVVVGTDGTAEARAALAAMPMFPWPAGATVTGVVASRTRAAAGRPGYVRVAIDRAYAQVAASARRTLQRRWPDARVDVFDEAPAEAILAEARRRRAQMIVLGSRHRGWIARHLLGSVSAAVVRHAPCAVLVVRGRPRAFDRIVVGVDGSRHARRAVELVRRLPKKSARAVTLVGAVESIRMPSAPFLPSEGRAVLARETARFNLDAEQRVRAELRRHQRTLRRAGWNARAVLVRGVPVQAFLSMAARSRARLLVVGARGAGGIERLLLGSVAESVLDRAPISVLIVR